MGRAKWHKARAVREYLSQHLHLEAFHFPPSCLQLNPQEHVWECTRDAVSHNHTRQDCPAMVQAFRSHLENTCFRFNRIEKYLPPTLLAV
jgi:hypothetical protein